MRYLNTVYVREHRAHVGHRRGSLLISGPEGKTRVPLEAVDAVVLLGSAQVSTDALAACTRRGVRVASLRRNGRIRFVVGGPRSGNVHLRCAQHAHLVDEGKCLDFARVVIAAKLRNSQRVLSRWARDSRDERSARRLATRAEQVAERIGHLPAAASTDHVRGIEGDAARIYFAGMGQVVATTPFRFTERNRRPPRDPVNALLGFCSGLLVSELTGAVEAVGLDHQLGFFHRPRSGRPALALDLSEEFRPLVDRFVVTLVRRRQVAPEDFVTTPGGAVYLNDEGRTKLIAAWEDHKNGLVEHRLLGREVERWALPSVQATLLARFLRGDLPSYPPFVTLW